jgi:hypothetical protein
MGGTASPCANLPVQNDCQGRLIPVQKELMRIAAGLPVPGLDSLKDLRFPEPAQR